MFVKAGIITDSWQITSNFGAVASYFALSGYLETNQKGFGVKCIKLTKSNKHKEVMYAYRKRIQNNIFLF